MSANHEVGVIALGHAAHKLLIEAGVECGVGLVFCADRTNSLAQRAQKSSKHGDKKGCGKYKSVVVHGASVGVWVR